MDIALFGYLLVYFSTVISAMYSRHISGPWNRRRRDRRRTA